MHSSKSDILALLKRNGGHSVGQLSAATGLAQMTVRQHLTHLQRDGLVISEPRPSSGGRPMLVFRLTARGHAAAFPRRSDRLAELLLREIGLLSGHELEGLSPEEKTRLVLQRLAERLAKEYGPLLQGWPLGERVAFVTEVMHTDGGFAEWSESGSGYEIRDFNCLFHRLVSAEGASCDWHQTFLTKLLGTEVTVVPCPDDAPACCFHVEPARTTNARSQLASASLSEGITKR